MRFFLFIVSSFFLIHCQSIDESLLEGKWKVTSCEITPHSDNYNKAIVDSEYEHIMSFSYTFYRDNTFSYNIMPNSKGEWIIEDDCYLTLTYPKVIEKTIIERNKVIYINQKSMELLMNTEFQDATFKVKFIKL